MFGVLKDVVAVVLQYGLLGVVVSAQAWWIYKLNEQLTAVQEKRVQDAYRFADTVKDCAVALERNTDVLNAFMKS